ncbi:MAG: exodeoxyribonuclease V subunit alpha [Rhodoferax sp.]
MTEPLPQGLSLPAEWANGPMSAWDWALAQTLQALAPSTHPHHPLLVALTSHLYSRGHACLDLAQLQTQGHALLGWESAWYSQLQRALPGSDWRLWVQDLPWVRGDASPLVQMGARLYLRRCAQAEAIVRDALAQRLAAPDPAHPVFQPQPAERIRAWMRLLFAPKTIVASAESKVGEADLSVQSGGSSSGPDWQQVACVLALRGRVTLITGGPGTGKTTTVVRLLALLQASATRALRLALAAPTGKAAARLSQSIVQAWPGLPALCARASQGSIEAGDGSPGAVPTQVPPLDITPAQTLHRLLRLRDGGQAPAVHSIAADVVVVDEASMIDLELMARLMLALPPSARLILLGDKDQLASVEAGAVMAQLCATAEAGGYDADTVRWVQDCCGQDISAWACAPDTSLVSRLAQNTVMLRHSHRFAHDSGIGQWAQRVNRGDVDGVRQAWARTPLWAENADEASADGPAVTRHVGQGATWTALLRSGWKTALALLTPLQAAGAVADADQARALLQALAGFQVLCALREGPFGVVHHNRVAARALGLSEQGWCVGRLVMVTRNDPALDLMNGDVGVALPTPRGLRVAFAQGAGVRWVLPSRLSAVEPAWAMTVHKSQGSEFDHVALVLPDRVSPLLTRELLYTGITRARQRLTLVVPQPQVLLHAVAQRLVRSGGLTLNPAVDRSWDDLRA